MTAHPSSGARNATAAPLRELRGRVERITQHGWQFTVVDYRVTLPATRQGMTKYLGSGLVKGIGPVNARWRPS